MSRLSGLRWPIFGIAVCLMVGLNFNDVNGHVSDEFKRNIPDHMYGISINDNGLALAVGYHASVFYSENSGINWSRIDVESNELFRRVDVNNSSQILTVGHKGGIYLANNVNEKFNKIFTAPTGYLRDVKFISDKVAIAVGKEGGIYRSTDNGNSWSKKEISGITSRDIPTINGISRIGNSDSVVAVGEFGAVFYSGDNGYTWENVPNIYENGLTAVESCSGCDYAVAVGLDGMIVQIKIKQNSVGLRKIKSGTKSHLFDLDFVGKTILVVGKSVVVEISKNGYEFKTYKNKTYDSVYSWMHGISVAPNGNVIGVGRRGDLIRGVAENFPNSYENFSNIN